MRPMIAAAAAVLLASASVAAPPPKQPEPDGAVPTAVREMQRAALKDTRAMQTLRSLTERVGPRLAGSDGDRAAVAWALETLTAQGFVNVRAEPVTVPRWLRGEASVRMVGEAEPDLVALALGGSVGTTGIEAEVLPVTDIEELKALPRSQVAGRIVFLYDRMLATRDGMDYRQTVRNRSQGPVEAAKLGAVGLVIRSIGTDDVDRPHTGGTRYANGVPRIPAFALGHLSADRLLARAARGPLRLRLTSTSRCDGTAESANVIGEIKGRGALERGSAEEFVLLGAHLDSWDVGTGAQDDGAGVAIVVEAARRVGELAERPRRTLRVVLFANEEFGLSGAKRYAFDHADELPRHAGGIEADLGSGRAWKFESLVRHAETPAAIKLASLLAPLGLRYEGNQADGGSDLTPMRDRGMPVFELQHDATRYFEIHHTAADTLDRVDAKDLAHNVAAYATFAWGLAESDTMFTPRERVWPAPSADVHPCEWQP